MRKAADLLRERCDHVSKVMVQEQGKVYPEARGEVLTSADIIDWYAEEGRRAYGRIVPGRQPGVRQLVTQEPVGVVAAFTPWNFPVLTPVRKIAGALAAGCSIIIKASEETPGACVELVKCFADAGVPAGVVNLVFGVPAEVSEYLIPSKIVKKISFTGSVPVGKHLAGARRQGHEARHHGARRPFAGGGVRGRRPGEGGRHHRRLQVPQRRPGLHLADPLLCAREELPEVPRPLHRICQGHQAWRRAGEGHHHGPARQSAPARRHGQLRRRRQKSRRQGRHRRFSARATRASSSSRR